MKKRSGHVAYLVGMFLVIMIAGLLMGMAGMTKAADQEKENTSRQVIRLGYAQVREYSSFAQQLLKLAEELEKEGSIEAGFSARYEGVDYDQKFKDGDTRTLWQDICDHNVEGAKFQFVRDAFFDMNVLRESEYETMVNREDVDVTLAMGTATGVYFKEHEVKNKYMVLLAADPIASGIVKSETERDTDNVYALIDRTTYQRQIKAGHKFLQFKKLGIVYEDSRDAYEYSAISSVMKEAEELGFEVLIENVNEPVSPKDEKRYYKELKEAYRRLIDRGMDTLYITVSSIDYNEKLEELLSDAIYENNIPTHAQDDVIPVINGALFGVSLVDYSEQANHIVTQLLFYQSGEKQFQELDQVCECTPKIFVNLTTAQKIGFSISFENLQLVDSIYR